jgi:hypothetical protein
MPTKDARIGNIKLFTKVNKKPSKILRRWPRALEYSGLKACR